MARLLRFRGSWAAGGGQQGVEQEQGGRGGQAVSRQAVAVLELANRRAHARAVQAVQRAVVVAVFLQQGLQRLQARAVAGAKAEAARQAVLTMLVIMAVILHLKYAHLSDPKNYPDSPNLYTVAAFLKVSVDLKGTNAPAKREAAHSESQKSENLSEEDQKRADVVLSELEELSVTPPSSNEDLTAAASENPVDHFLQEGDYQQEFTAIYKEKLAAYRKEKIGLEDDAKGFIQTITELGTFPHVPVKGIQIPRWDSASGSYKTEVMKPEDLRKLYPDAISLNNPNYM